MPTKSDHEEFVAEEYELWLERLIVIVPIVIGIFIVLPSCIFPSKEKRD